MKTITYKFNTGKINKVEVTDKFYTYYNELESEERRRNRRESRRHVSLERLIELGADIQDRNADIEYIFVQRELRQWIEAALKILTEKQRTVFILYAEEGLSFYKIGLKLSLNKDTIKGHYRAAIKKLKKYFLKIPPQNAFLMAI